MELPHVQPREAGVMGVSLNRAASRISLRRNGDLGVYMEISDHNHIQKNRMRGHPEGGVIAEGHGNVFNRNRIVRGGGGVLITKITDHGAVGNVVRRNKVRNVRAAGIAVDPPPGTHRDQAQSCRRLRARGHRRR